VLALGQGWAGRNGENSEDWNEKKGEPRIPSFTLQGYEGRQQLSGGFDAAVDGHSSRPIVRRHRALAFFEVCNFGPQVRDLLSQRRHFCRGTAVGGSSRRW